MFSSVKELINGLDIDAIPLSRKQNLNQLSDYIKQSLENNEKATLNFICTHNSRRSHLCQIWAQIAACYYKVSKIQCYSGGTEATAVFPKIIETLQAQGLEITKRKPQDNPNYYIRYSEIMPSIEAFSKLFDNPSNPSSQFAAIMTCDHASENCPFVPGAEKRIAITYLDPKASDGTPEQTAIYEERSLQIATEMKYVFSQVISK